MKTFNKNDKYYIEFEWGAKIECDKKPPDSGLQSLCNTFDHLWMPNVDFKEAYERGLSNKLKGDE